MADRAGMELWKLQPGDLVQANYKDGADLWKKLTSGQCWYDAPVSALQELRNDLGQTRACAEFARRQRECSGGGDQIYLPHFVQLSPSGDEKEYPLLLVSYRTMALANEYLPNPPFMTKTLWDFVLKGNDLFVELNPQTAQSLGYE